MQLAADTDPAIRFQTAYALGHVGTPAAIKQLEVMVDDPDAGTRYNAASRARPSRQREVDRYADRDARYERSRPVCATKRTEGKAFKRTVIIVSAIDAAHALARQNKQANLAPIISALEQIASADKETLRKSECLAARCLRCQGRARPDEGREVVVARRRPLARLGIAEPCQCCIGCTDYAFDRLFENATSCGSSVAFGQHVGRQ